MPLNINGYKPPLRRAVLGAVGIVLATSSYSVAAATWVPLESGATNQLTHVQFSSATEGWAAGSGGIALRTFDSGATWTTLDTGLGAALGHNSIHFLSSSTGWVSGLKVVGRTVDTGSTWEGASPLPGAVDQPPFFNRLFAFTPTEAWLVGGDAGVLMAWRYVFNADRSISITEMAIDKPDLFYDVAFVNSNAGWAVGSRGTIFKISGALEPQPAFELQETGTDTGLNAVFMLSESEGWVVGDGGLVLHTSDGGAGWLAQSSEVAENLNDVHFVSATHGWIVGADGLILGTTDGGQSWVREESGVRDGLVSLDFIGQEVGFAVGSRGTILKRVTEPSSDGLTESSVLSGEPEAESADSTGCACRAAGTGGESWALLAISLLATSVAIRRRTGRRLLPDGPSSAWIGGPSAPA